MNLVTFRWYASQISALFTDFPCSRFFFHFNFPCYSSCYFFFCFFDLILLSLHNLAAGQFSDVLHSSAYSISLISVAFKNVLVLSVYVLH